MSPGRRRVFWYIAGAAATAAAGLGAWLARRRLIGDLRSSAQAVACARAAGDRIRSDESLAARGIEVIGLADGIVELQGTVGSAMQSHQAMELAQQPESVRIVLNRLVVRDEPGGGGETRRSFAARGAAPRGTHWYGTRRGMGRRGVHGEDPQGAPDEEVETAEPDENA